MARPILADWRGIYRFDSGEHLLLVYKSGHRATHAGVKSPAEGQKGALLTAVLKMLDPLVLVLLWLIAFHLYQDLPKADMAYPTLVNNVLPVPMVGFFGAVLFGAVISTFNGFLNSASTLFSMGIYRRIINQNAEPQQLVTVGRKFGFFIAIVSVLVAPWIANAPQGCIAG